MPSLTAKYHKKTFVFFFPLRVCVCVFRVSSRESSPRFSTWLGRTTAFLMTPLTSWTLWLWYGLNGLDRTSQWWYTAGTVLSVSDCSVCCSIGPEWYIGLPILSVDISPSQICWYWRSCSPICADIKTVFKGPYECYYVIVFCQHQPQRLHKPHLFSPNYLYQWDIVFVCILSIFNKFYRKHLKMFDNNADVLFRRVNYIYLATFTCPVVFLYPVWALMAVNGV